MNFFTRIIISLIVALFAIKAYGLDENTITPEKIAATFESVLKSKGWNTFADRNSVNAWIFDSAYQSLKLTVEYKEKDVNSFGVTINSKRNSTEFHKTFLFNKKNHNSIEYVNAVLTPYLISLIDIKTENENRSSYYSSLKLGYYRTNDNREILPSKNGGMFFIGWKFAYDPTRDERESSIPLYVGDYLDSSFTLSINRKAEGYSKFDEFAFDVDMVLYGKSKKEFKEEKSTRNLYGLFTGMTYFRPFLKTTAVQWSDDLYTDHIHIQYCYWEPVAFIHNLTFVNNTKSVSFKYRIGIGPCQNSSITAVSIAPGSDRENNINPIFKSRWYFNNDKGDRKHNYYYSIAVPVKLEFESDKYFNSKFEFKYHFYYFQAIMDKRTQDFLNHIVLNYGYYITNDITIGCGYEFWHVKGIENEYKNSHSWNRFSIQAEMKI